MKSLINRRASKRVSINMKKLGRPSQPAAKQKPTAKPLQNIPSNKACPDYIEEKGTCYPLCDNPTCARALTCNLSAHMKGPYDKL